MWIADGVLQAGFLYVVTTSDVVIEGIPLNFPSHGIYTLFASGEVPQFSYTEIGSCVIHQLDEKFIPDTIARVSDMPSISGLASEDYVDAKVASIPTPDVSGQINTHNTATDAHNDIREEINAIQSYILSIDYESLLAFDTSEIVIGSLTNTTSVLGQAILGQMVLA